MDQAERRGRDACSAVLVRILKTTAFSIASPNLTGQMVFFAVFEDVVCHFITFRQPPSPL